MINAVVFDLGRVIADFDHMKSCRSLSSFSDLSPEQIYQKIFKSNLEKRFDQGELSPSDFYQEIGRIIKANNELTFSSFYEIWGNIFSENPEIKTVLKKIKPEIKIFLFSNTNKIHWHYISQIEVIKSYFVHAKKLVLSFQVGYRKPDPRAFQEVILRCKNDPPDILYIDDIPEYIKVFEKLGGHGIVYNCQTDPIERLTKELSYFNVLE